MLSVISRLHIHKRNLLEARVIIASYNDHVRPLSPGPWLVGTTKVIRVWEPTLLWNQLHSSPQRKAMMSVMGILRQLLALRRFHSVRFPVSNHTAR